MNPLLISSMPWPTASRALTRGGDASRISDAPVSRIFGSSMNHFFHALRCMRGCPHRDGAFDTNR